MIRVAPHFVPDEKAWHLPGVRIWNLIFGDDAIEERTIFVELGCHFTLFAFGVWVLITPGASMTAQIYRMLVDAIPENLLAIFFSGVGLMGLVCIECSNRDARRIALWPTMGSWIALTASALMSMPYAPGVMFVGMGALASMWAFIKLGAVRDRLDG